MIPIARAALPPEVVDRMTVLTDRILLTAVEDQASRAKALWRQGNVRRDVKEPVRAVLKRMAGGRDRCMYCWDSEGTAVDHHEPLARNPVRAFDWLNHLLACEGCNSDRKGGRYPVDSRDRPLLIDPTAEDPFDRLVLSLTVGHYLPLTEKGRRTIEVLDLNRSILTRGRVTCYSTVVLWLRQWPDAVVGRGFYRPEELLEQIRWQPFADVCQSMLRQVGLPGAATIFSREPDVIDVLRDEAVRRALMV
ncbi:hypothetical protein [Actinoplanes derwentensis]|uniref:TIGR02646 family protein n=1 Tax=Actinoplanes derwentensis TaxID=113562 RepID=A0A1H2DBJ9_9ACTN|nr:hypothetical protein [Actinoplanes derwentensis]GID88523.1 HNH endonuclease [Actinoplanes derwentensis]SDT79969.1 TIGR02646 family protein [Actinoplanes derwentensis]